MRKKHFPAHYDNHKLARKQNIFLRILFQGHILFDELLLMAFLTAVFLAFFIAVFVAMINYLKLHGTYTMPHGLLLHFEILA